MTKVCHRVSHIKRVQCLFGLSTTPILLPAAVLRGRSHPGGCLARIHSHLHTIRKAQTGLQQFIQLIKKMSNNIFHYQLLIIWHFFCLKVGFDKVESYLKYFFHTMFSTDFIVFSLQIIWRGTLSKMWNNIFSLFR